MRRFKGQQVVPGLKIKVWPADHDPGVPGDKCQCRCDECVLRHPEVDQVYREEAT